MIAEEGGGAISFGLNKTIVGSVGSSYVVDTGTPFQYALTYWAAAEPGTLVIEDLVPAGLEFLLVTAPSNANASYTATPQTTGETLVKIQLPGPQGWGAQSGSSTCFVQVRFPQGTTCDGVTVCNTKAKICRSADPSNWQPAVELSTGTWCATSHAQKKWVFKKYVKSPVPPACGGLDSVVTFRVVATNPSGSNVGGLDLGNLTITDTIPQYAVLKDVRAVNIGAANFASGSVSLLNCGTGLVSTGAAITLNTSPINIPVSAFGPFDFGLEVDVEFPSSHFSSSSPPQTNTATFSYTLGPVGPTPSPCSQTLTETKSASINLCTVVIVPPPQTAAHLIKQSTFVTLAPGCDGQYYISYANSSNGPPLSPLVVDDTLPGQVQLTNIKLFGFAAAMLPCTVDVYAWNGTTCGATPAATYSFSTMPSSLNVDWNAVGAPALPANACRVKITFSGTTGASKGVTAYLFVDVLAADFKTGNSVVAGDHVVNNVTADNLSAGTNDVVVPSAPKVARGKYFIGKWSNCSTSQSNTAGPWFPGDKVRFRLTVQNYGDQDLTNFTIDDVLPAGLTYADSATYYYGTQLHPSCSSMNSTIPSAVLTVGGNIGTAVEPTVGQSSLHWVFPILPHGCSISGTSTFAVEFDVELGAALLAGTHVNPKFSVSGNDAAGGPYGPVDSGPASFAVAEKFGLLCEKAVREWPSGTFVQNVNVIAGAEVEYRLRLTNQSNTPMTNYCLLDVMPHAPAATDYQSAWPYTPPRGINPNFGSEFDLPARQGSPLTATPAGATWSFAADKDPKRLPECNGFAMPVVEAPSATTPAWVASNSAAPAGMYSVRASASGLNVMPGQSADVYIRATVPAGAPVGKKAWNDFAATASFSTLGGGTIVQTCHVQPVSVTVIPRQAVLCVHKFSDLDGDGEKDPNEPGVANWSFTVSDPVTHAVVATITTDSTGEACVTLPLGTYEVAEVAQSGWLPTRPKWPVGVTLDEDSPTHVRFLNQKCDTIALVGGSATGGVDDQFAATNTETATPSGPLQIAMGATIEHSYDGTTTSRKFGETFALPQGGCVARAILEFRARPLPHPALNSANDVVQLGFAASGSFLPAPNEWHSLLGTLAGNTWSPNLFPAPTGHVFALDLSALPGGVDLLPKLNLLRELDFFVFDDTSVDYVRLTVTICPCSGRLCVRKFLDVDGNGTKDEKDGWIGGFSFQVRDSTGAVAATLTLRGDETIACVDLPAGVYSVTEPTPPPPWMVTTPNPAAATVVGGETTTVTFGNTRAEHGSICIRKYWDQIANGQHDATEPWLTGWQFVVLDATGNAFTLTTNPPGTDGMVCKDVPPGTYRIVEVTKPGWTPVASMPLVVNVPLGTPTVVDVGNVRCGETGPEPTGSICVRKFFDENRDRRRQGDEPLLAGWTFVVTDAAGNVVATITSNADGDACVGGLKPGTYTVTEDLSGHPGWVSTTGTTQLATVVAGGKAPVQFGNFRRGDEGGPGRICVTKFLDENRNQRQDPTEPLLGGWTILVRDAMGNPVATIRTSADAPGCIENLKPGTFTLTEQLAGHPGWSSTTGVNQTVVVRSGQTTPVVFGNVLGEAGDAGGGGVGPVAPNAVVRVEGKGFEPFEGALQSIRLTSADGVVDITPGRPVVLRRETIPYADLAEIRFEWASVGPLYLSTAILVTTAGKEVRFPSGIVGLTAIDVSVDAGPGRAPGTYSWSLRAKGRPKEIRSIRWPK